MKNKTVAISDVNVIALKYAEYLTKRPLLTKALTSAFLSFSSEIAATNLSNFPVKPLKNNQKTGVFILDWLRLNQRAVKLGLYGFFISAPLAHYFMLAVHKLFRGHNSIKAKILMILVLNFIVNPIQQSAFIFALGRINEIGNMLDLVQFWRKNIFPMMRLSWVSSPLAVVFSQIFLSPEMWVPFFSFIAVTLGTIVNIRTKRRILDQMRKRNQRKPKAKD